MTIVCNLYGGPGTGKSTNATYVFSQLKRQGIVAEYVSEYAKDITWEETHSLLNNQIHLFSEQFRRQWRLLNKVDVIVTDSPLLLGLVYFEHYITNDSNFTIEFEKCIKSTIYNGFLQFDNLNYFLIREKEYVKIGRNQTESEAIELDSEVKEVLNRYNVDYNTIKTSVEEMDNTVIPDIIKKLNNR